MRKISEQAADAVIFGLAYKNSNTQVDKCIGGARMYLFGNLIAERINGVLRITNSGYFTNTTKDRLNAFPKVSINQCRDKWFLNGVEWDGKWITI